MTALAIFGAGRIGRVHAENIAARADARVKYIVDPAVEAAEALAGAVGATTATTDTVFADPEIAGVIIASATSTHAELVSAAAAAGRPVFCEKPLSLDFAETLTIADTVRGADLPFMVGFQRRYDPAFREVRQRIRDGDAGALEQLLIITRDPSPPPARYIETSGGMVRDQAIHDLDMARYLLDEPIASVSAHGSALFDGEISRLGDIDTLHLTLIAESGRQVAIVNSRHCPAGFDQRLEALCASEVLRVANQPSGNLHIGDGRGTTLPRPEGHFIERYRAAYREEMGAFLDLIRDGTPPLAGLEDGVEAQRLAETAVRALETGTPQAPGDH